MLDSLLHEAYDLADSLGRNETLLDNVRLVLVHVYVPAMASLLALTAAAVLMSLTPLRARLGAIPARAWTRALLLFNVALALRLFWAPHMPQVYLDEISFLNTSDNMARHDLNLLSTVNEVSGALFHPCPAGWQFLISRAYKIVGVRPEVAFTLAAVMSALSVLLLFLVLFEMTGRTGIGLWGALFLTVLPVHLRLSGSAALETPSLFFLLATLYSLLVWRATRARSMLLLAATCFSWFANTRMENTFALGPLLLIYAVVLWPREARTRTDLAVAIGCGLVAVGFSLPALLADFYGVATRFYFFYQSQKVTETQIVSNWQGNVPYWFDNVFHPMMLTMLALIAVVGAMRRVHRRRDIIFWLAWTLALVGFYTMNPSCDFALRHTLDSWRTALHPALGVIILAAIGTQMIIDTAARPVMRRAATLTIALAACLTPWLFRDFIFMRHTWMLQWDAMAQMRTELPSDAFLLVYDHSTSLSPNSPGLAYQLALTTGTVPHYFIFAETSDPATQQAPPQIVGDVGRWKVEKRKMFLYHLDAGRVQDSHDLFKMQALFAMRPVGGLSMRANHATFSLWRIDGAAPRPQAPPTRKAR